MPHSADDYQNLNVPIDEIREEIQEPENGNTSTTSVSASLVEIPTPIIENVISTVSLGVPLDLKKIARNARDSEYDPLHFAALIMRIRDPRTTALIFQSGKIVCSGAKSKEASIHAIRKYAKTVRKLGYQTKLLNFKIQNIVASSDMHIPIDLANVNKVYRHCCTYEPELFPGLTYRLVNTRIAIIIFLSGKLNILGAKSEEEIENALRYIHPILKNFRRPTS